MMGPAQDWNGATKRRQPSCPF